MRVCTAAFTALAIAVPVFSSPVATAIDIKKYAGETTGRYIVKLKDTISKSSILDKLNSAAHIKVTHDWTLVHGFAGNFDAAALDVLRSSPEVEYIEEDGIMNAFKTQTDAPWGLGRISSATSLSGQSDDELTFSYTYDASAGSGVDIYVVDTGVFTNHSTFGGRARWGATFGGYPSADGNGHGTHCAGTAAGSQYGVAKAASIIAVKVLSDDGSGALTDVISGLDWVASQAAASGRPSIVSLSLGGSPSTALDDAVNTLSKKGIHVAVAAGNDDTDAGSSSPARAAGVVTVGASTIDDERASFSNFGAVVDVWAPGENIISAWIDGTTDTNSISGTSMATPHIAGLIAYLIGLQGNISTSAMRTKLQKLSLKKVLSDIPSGTVNDLAHNA